MTKGSLGYSIRVCEGVLAVPRLQCIVDGAWFFPCFWVLSIDTCGEEEFLPFLKIRVNLWPQERENSMNKQHQSAWFTQQCRENGIKYREVGNHIQRSNGKIRTIEFLPRASQYRIVIIWVCFWIKWKVQKLRGNNRCGERIKPELCTILIWSCYIIKLDSIKMVANNWSRYDLTHDPCILNISSDIKQDGSHEGMHIVSSFKQGK